MEGSWKASWKASRNEWKASWKASRNEWKADERQAGMNGLGRQAQQADWNEWMAGMTQRDTCYECS